MTIFKQRSLGTLCGACIVTLVALGFSAAPARAQSFIFPPEVTFIADGKYTGTLVIDGKTMPITGSIAYLVSGPTRYLHISVDTEGQLITSDTWLVQTATAINQWEIVSTDPTTCRKEVLSEKSYPQCSTFVGGGWPRTQRGVYVLQCPKPATVQGNKVTLQSIATLSPTNQLVSMQQDITITGQNGDSPSNLTPVFTGPLGTVLVTSSILITMTEQGTTPPIPSDFNRPDICNASNSTQGENENLCTGTIPNICF
jgi:hypothetical protein